MDFKKENKKLRKQLKDLKEEKEKLQMLCRELNDRGSHSGGPGGYPFHRWRVILGGPRLFRIYKANKRVDEFLTPRSLLVELKQVDRTLRQVKGI